MAESLTTDSPDGLAESLGTDHFRPVCALLPAGFAFEPFTGLVSGSGVFGGTHTFGGLSAA
ncbi:hypothetical protein [Streptomyces sp. NPDC091371]|uniref:hypothetical protein n=1 Tax=Streptomyces sp. NPDC091371 TaxID=3155303 RepID=UPI003449CECF